MVWILLILLRYAVHNNNSIEYNDGYGIAVSGADSLMVRDNIVKSNTIGFGIIGASDGVVFLSNNFISNDDGLSETLA